MTPIPVEADQMLFAFSGEPPVMCWGLRIDDECKAQGRTRDGSWIKLPELFELWSASGEGMVPVEFTSPLAYLLDRSDAPSWRGAPQGAVLELRAEPSPLARLVVDGECVAYYTLGLWWLEGDTEPGSALELAPLSIVVLGFEPLGPRSRASDLAG